MFDTDATSHVQNVRACWARLRPYDLELSPSKATVGTLDADFLGHANSLAGVRPNAKKVEALTDMPMPTDVKQLRSLLGRLSYYRKFLPNLSKQLRSATALLKRRASFHLSRVMEDTFRGLLAQLVELPTLVFSDWNAVENGSRPS